MKVSIILLSLLSFSAEDKAVIDSFNKSKTVKDLFFKDPANNRSMARTFEEDEFVPAGDKMIELLSKQTCFGCMEEYLKGLSYFEVNSNEEFSDQLQKIFSTHPKILNDACKNVGKEVKERNKIKFSIAFNEFVAMKKMKKEKLKKIIAECI